MFLDNPEFMLDAVKLNPKAMRHVRRAAGGAAGARYRQLAKVAVARCGGMAQFWAWMNDANDDYEDEDYDYDEDPEPKIDHAALGDLNVWLTALVLSGRPK